MPRARDQVVLRSAATGIALVRLPSRAAISLAVPKPASDTRRRSRDSETPHVMPAANDDEIRNAKAVALSRGHSTQEAPFVCFGNAVAKRGSRQCGRWRSGVAAGNKRERTARTRAHHALSEPPDDARLAQV